MSKKILALDLGLTSCGYSVLDELENDRYSLVDYGVFMFDNPINKDGKSKKLLHAQSQSASKLVNLRKERKKNLAKVFEKFGFGDKEYFLYQEKLWQKKKHKLIPKWELRCKKAFEEKLKIEELFSIFYTISKHRGYKSLDSNDLLEELCKEKGIELNIKQSKKDDEKGQIKQALKTIEDLKQKYPQKTVAQIIYEKELKEKNPSFRNHDNYKYMIRREYINDEIEKLIKTQEKIGLFSKNFNTDNFVDNLIKTIDDQKESSNDMNLFANCEFYPNHKVAHQYSLISDIFKMYQSISNITFNKSEKITKEQIKLIEDNFFSKIKKGVSISDIKYKDIRKILKLSDEIKIFNKEDSYISKNKTIQNTIIKFHFLPYLKKFDASFILKALEGENPYDDLKNIFDTLEFEKSPKKIYEKLKPKINDDKTIIELIKNKNGNSLRISSDAMIKFIPYFQKGYTSDEIKEKLNLKKSEDYNEFKKGIKYLNLSQFEKDDKLDINNHIVKYVVSAVLRLIKHLHNSYGTFDEIKVESTRELSLSNKVKKEIEKANKEFEKQINEIVDNKEYQKIAKHYGKNLKKYARKILMYKEQNGRDIYTGKGIEFSDIFTHTVDIDHIVPQSLGGLSVKHNLVLVHKNSNLEKSNQLPMNFIQNKQDFINRVEDLFSERKINWKKKINLLSTNLDEIFKDKFESKSLRATSYIESLTAQVLKRYYPFVNLTKQKDGSAVRHIQGRATANIRKVLQIKAKTRDTNIHHACDAILIGITNHSWLQKLSNTFRENVGLDDYEEAMQNIKKDIPLIDGIESSELIQMVEDKYNEYGENSVFYKDIWDKTKVINYWVSRKPMVSKVHKDTIYAKKENGIFTVRENIINNFKNLKLTSQTTPEDFIKKFEKNISSKMYLYKTNSNDAICKAVQHRADDIVELLKEFIWLDSKDKEAMADAKIKLDSLINKPIYDNNGNEIRKVKFYQTNLTGFNTRGGLAIKEKTFIGFQSSLKNDELTYDRIDISNAQKINGKYVAKDNDSFKVYKNDIIFFIFEDGSFKGGKIVSFLEDKKITAFSNPKFPASITNQPHSFLTIFNGKPNSHKQVSIGKAIGIIKINLDILGNIKSYNVIGKVQSELLNFIKSIKR